MRKIIVIEFMTLDGVMQAPGGPSEDPSGDFRYGGWVAPYFDSAAGEIMRQQMAPAAYLLGRRTFDIFAGYWPSRAEAWPGIHEGMKYVFSNTATESPWQNTLFLNSVEAIEALKKTEGPDLQVWGSGQLVQLLLAHDLVDALWLKIFPVTLGSGKRLFGTGTLPAAFTLTESAVTPTGVLFANYTRAGAVKTGTVGE